MIWDVLLRAGMAGSIIAALLMLHFAFRDFWDDPSDVD